MVGLNQTPNMFSRALDFNMRTLFPQHFQKSRACENEII